MKRVIPVSKDRRAFQAKTALTARRGREACKDRREKKGIPASVGPRAYLEKPVRRGRRVNPVNRAPQVKRASLVMLALPGARVLKVTRANRASPVRKESPETLARLALPVPRVPKATKASRASPVRRVSPETLARLAL